MNEEECVAAGKTTNVGIAFDEEDHPGVKEKSWKQRRLDLLLPSDGATMAEMQHKVSAHIHLWTEAI